MAHGPLIHEDLSNKIAIQATVTPNITTRAIFSDLPLYLMLTLCKQQDLVSSHLNHAWDRGVGHC